VTAADQAAEAITTAMPTVDEGDVYLPLETVVGTSLGAVMPDGRTVAQTLNDGATAERLAANAGPWKEDAYGAFHVEPTGRTAEPDTDPEAGEYLRRMGFA